MCGRLYLYLYLYLCLYFVFRRLAQFRRVWQIECVGMRGQLAGRSPWAGKAETSILHFYISLLLMMI